MQLVKLLDIANPKNTKEIINELIINYDGFESNITGIANEAKDIANNAKATAEQAIDIANESAEAASQAVTQAENAATDAANSATLTEQAQADAANSALDAEQSKQDAADALLAAEQAMSAANDAKDIINNAITTGRLGTIIYDTSAKFLFNTRLTNDINIIDTPTDVYLATPLAVRNALADYYNKTEIAEQIQNAVPTNISELNNDKGYITEVPAEYITEIELADKNYATKEYVNTNGGKIDKITVNNIEQPITDKTVNIALSDYVEKANIVDALDSTAIDKPLSANQGKVLNESILTIKTSLSNKLNLTGGTLTGEVTIGQGDGKGLQFGTNGVVNANNTTNTIFGLLGNSALTVGHSAFNLTTRGKGTRPTYNTKELALKEDISNITIDSALSETSENPVQNKVINEAIKDKLNTSGGKLTGNLNVNDKITLDSTNGNVAGNYLKGTWFQSTSAYNGDIGASAHKIAVIRNDGWLYTRTVDSLKEPLGVPTEYVKDATKSTDGKTLTLTKQDGSTVDFASGDSSITIDDALSSTSTNPVQNKVVNTAITNITNNTTIIKNDKGGFAAGERASTMTGGAIGVDAESLGGGAVGYSAITSIGGAIGVDAESLGGGAVGQFARAGDGFSGGYKAAAAIEQVAGKRVVINAIQLGEGLNYNEYTLQVYDDNLYNASTHTLGTALCNAIYPIGSIYIQETSGTVNVGKTPMQLFPNTNWAKIEEGRFLRAVSGATGGKGGEATHTLTIDEMPSHTHSYTYDNNDNHGGSDVALRRGREGTRDVSYTGGNKPHNNLPPYINVIIWKRIG